MSKAAFDKIAAGLDEAALVAPYVAEIERLRAENKRLTEENERLDAEIYSLYYAQSMADRYD